MTMQLTDTAREKIERYLIQLGAAMTTLPAAERDENVREIRAHILDTVNATGGPLEEAVDVVLARLGAADALACQFEREGSFAQASRSLSPLVWLRTTARWALTGVEGFTAFLVALSGYGLGFCMLLAGLLKPFLPNMVGLFVSSNGVTLNRLDVPGEQDILGSYFLPFALCLGGGLIIGTTFLLKQLVRFCGQAKHALAGK